MLYQVIVIGIKKDRTAYNVGNTEEEMKSMTVKQLKKKIADKYPTTKAVEMRLIFTNKQLEDSYGLGHYGIQNQSIIMQVLILPGGHDWLIMTSQ
uniref:Ubiquitin-like domain-containing protein n=1 Tax=Oncorhynchus mykiss TaxID=8022 RepID=A0A8L0DNK6_ONCMY